jgi:predicted nucleic acid-binding protein
VQDLLVDSNVILDVFTDDPVWADWSESMLERYSVTHSIYINPIIYSEISIGFTRIEELEEIIEDCGFQVRQIPREALFLAGKVFLQYRRAKGSKRSPLPDFYIGAHAAVEGMALLTRDVPRFQTYFPSVEMIHPK